MIILILSGYFLTVVALGVYYSRRSKSTEDFILAGHSLTTPFVTGSVVATWLGGAVILGGATEAFVGGFQAIVWDPWSPFLTLLIVGFFSSGYSDDPGLPRRLISTMHGIARALA